MQHALQSGNDFHRLIVLVYLYDRIGIVLT